MITDADICSQSLLSKFALTVCCELLFLFDPMAKENHLKKLEKNIPLNIADGVLYFLMFFFFFKSRIKILFVQQSQIVSNKDTYF